MQIFSFSHWYSMRKIFIILHLLLFFALGPFIQNMWGKSFVELRTTNDKLSLKYNLTYQNENFTFVKINQKVNYDFTKEIFDLNSNLNFKTSFLEYGNLANKKELTLLNYDKNLDGSTLLITPVKNLTLFYNSAMVVGLFYKTKELLTAFALFDNQTKLENNYTFDLKNIPLNKGFIFYLKWDAIFNLTKEQTLKTKLFSRVALKNIHLNSLTYQVELTYKYKILEAIYNKKSYGDLLLPLTYQRSSKPLIEDQLIFQLKWKIIRGKFSFTNTVYDFPIYAANYQPMDKKISIDVCVNFKSFSLEGNFNYSAKMDKRGKVAIKYEIGSKAHFNIKEVNLLVDGKYTIGNSGNWVGGNVTLMYKISESLTGKVVVTKLKNSFRLTYHFVLSGDKNSMEINLSSDNKQKLIFSTYQ